MMKEGEEAKEILEELADIAKTTRELEVRKAKVFVKLFKLLKITNKEK